MRGEEVSENLENQCAWVHGHSRSRPGLHNDHGDVKDQSDRRRQSDQRRRRICGKWVNANVLAGGHSDEHGRRAV